VTVRVVGLDRELSAALAPWRRPLAVHDPAKIVLDLAVTLALGGDCLTPPAGLIATPAVPTKKGWLGQILVDGVPST
jgi:hypothetical protein